MDIMCSVYTTLKPWGYPTIVLKDQANKLSRNTFLFVDLKGRVPSSQKFDISNSKLFNNIMYLHGNHVFRGKSKCQLNNWNSYVVVKGAQKGVLAGEQLFND